MELKFESPRYFERGYLFWCQKYIKIILKFTETYSDDISIALVGAYIERAKSAAAAIELETTPLVKSGNTRELCIWVIDQDDAIKEVLAKWVKEVRLDACIIKTANSLAHRQKEFNTLVQELLHSERLRSGLNNKG